MRIALELNFALWGMILCAAVKGHDLISII
jgi:hypothetical protein